LARRPQQCAELACKVAIVERGRIEVQEQAVAEWCEPQRLLDDVQVDFACQAQFLGDADKVSGSDERAVVLHARQRLVGDRLAGVDVADRLERRQQVAGFERIAQLEALTEDRHERLADVR